MRVVYAAEMDLRNEFISNTKKNFGGLNLDVLLSSSETQYIEDSMAANGDPISNCDECSKE